MHTHSCVLIEISMKIGTLKFLIGIIGHCTDERNLLYDDQLIMKGKFEIYLLQLFWKNIFAIAQSTVSNSTVSQIF